MLVFIVTAYYRHEESHNVKAFASGDAANAFCAMLNRYQENQPDWNIPRSYGKWILNHPASGFKMAEKFEVESVFFEN